MGIVFCSVALVFLLDLPWGRIRPIFIIVAGLGCSFRGCCGATGTDAQDRVMSRDLRRQTARPMNTIVHTAITTAACV